MNWKKRRAEMRRPTVPPTAGLPLKFGDLLPWRGGDFSQALAHWLGVPSVQLECSGTSALMVALRSLKAQKPERSEVIAPAYTCPLVALAVAQSGLQLRLCDLRTGVLDMDTDRLRDCAVTRRWQCCPRIFADAWLTCLPLCTAHVQWVLM